MSNSNDEIDIPTPEERLNMLGKAAYKIPFENFDVQCYLRILRNMINMISTYEQDNRKEQAYVLASRFIVVYLEHLSKRASHRDFDIREWDTRCKLILSKAETLKAELRSRYELDYQEHLASIEAKKAAKAAEIAKMEAREAEQARLQEAKRASVLGQLVPKATVPRIGDNESTRPTPGYPSFSFPSVDNKPASPKVETRIPPTIDRSLKPATVKPNIYGWSPLRISPELAHRFLQLAERSTTSNCETCGSLCGQFVKGEYQVTALVLPKQSGTPDSCTTYKEEELFEFADKHGLIVLGWIHTHPSQTAFLSSVDQHSQVSYQIMLPEAIAIVCAPKYGEIKTFSLTPQQGIPYVLNCKKTGFHPHRSDTNTIYEQSIHVVEDTTLAFSVVDLR